MNKTLTSLLATCALYPALSFAEIEISPANGVDILAINGKPVESETFFSGTPELKIQNGKAQIVAEYTAEIVESADDYILENSDTFVLTFEASDTTIRVQAPQISSQYALNEFNKQGNWKLLDAQGNSISYSLGKLEKEGFQLDRDYEKELKKFNRSNAEAALGSLTVETHSFQNSAPAYQPEGNAHPDQVMVGKMLQFWYEQANTETKNKFKSWIETSH
ncbi:hypothetical protein GCM10009104_32410 [Marinobacterium maritimum]|uniref:UPF0319 protein GCM10009104_32410 n=1 Tax=Marinobacterium maritimum TaxID=500162 RepID=A0ABN1I9Y3_9GAMM